MEKKKFTIISGILILIFCRLVFADPIQEQLKHSEILPDEVKKKLGLVDEMGVEKFSSLSQHEQEVILKQHYADLVSGTLAFSTVGVHPTRLTHKVRQTDGSMDWSTERKKLHEEIIANVLGAPEHHRPSVGSRPTLIFSGGAPGSGKSSVLSVMSEHGYVNPADFVVIDADNIRERLPEFKSLRDYCHKEQVGRMSPAYRDRCLEKISMFSTEEADYISAVIQDRALAMGKNVIRDTTLRNTKYFAEVIAQASEKGYDVGIFHVDVSQDTAWTRVLSRASVTGRKVSPEYFRIATPVIIDQSANILRKFCKFYIKINNENQDPILQVCQDSVPKVTVENIKKLTIALQKKMSGEELIHQLKILDGPSLRSINIKIKDLDSRDAKVLSCVRPLQLVEGVPAPTPLKSTDTQCRPIDNGMPVVHQVRDLMREVNCHY